MKTIYILFLLILVFPENTYSDSDPSKIFLSLKDVTEQVLEKNLDISIESINPKIRRREIIEDKAEFDPEFSLSFSANKTVEPSASAFASPNIGVTESRKWDMKISQKLFTGGNYEFAFSNERLKTNSKFAGLNPQYVPRLILSVTQPLLKNFGDAANSRNIKISKNNKRISDNRFTQMVIDIISETQKGYWDLIFRLEDLKVRNGSLELAEEFESRIKVHVEVGTMAPIEILQAKAEVASREEAVIIAENEVKNSEDRLKKILNILEGPAVEEKSIIPTDKPLFTEQTVSVEESLKTAFKKRPGLLDAKLELKNRKIDIQYRKNLLFPTVDLSASFGLNGLSGTAIPTINLNTGGSSSSSFGGSYGDGLDRLVTGKYYEWEAGLTFGVPIGNRSAQSRYTAAKLEAEKQLIALKNLEQKIYLEVREAVRKIQTAIKRIHATSVSRKLAEEKLQAEEKRFEVGLSTSFNVLEFQHDLSEEQIKEIKSLIDYKKSFIDLERVTGDTLEKNGIELSG